MSFFGRLSWEAIPFHEPIPLMTSIVVLLARCGGRRLGHAQGLVALSVERIHHLHRPQEDRHHVHRARAGDAGARLCRCDHDAGPASRRGGLVARLSAARALRPDLLRPRHDHDLLHGDAVRHRADELRRAAPARSARRRLPDDEQRQLLADRLGRAAGQCQPVRRRVRAHRLARLPALERDAILARRRRRLLSRGAADIRRRDAPDRRQFRHHHPQDPSAGHELFADAGVLLDVARREPADHRRLPGADGRARAADARPLSRLPFLHHRRRRQFDALHEPDLGLGASGGLHPRPARIRHLFRGRLDLLGQALVRLPLDGLRDARDLHHLVHGLAAPFLHHGRGRGRQRGVRNRQHGHRRFRPG